MLSFVFYFFWSLRNRGVLWKRERMKMTPARKLRKKSGKVCISKLRYVCVFVLESTTV
jgi:hypothetical protein